jgi:hypothetical protein
MKDAAEYVDRAAAALYHGLDQSSSMILDWAVDQARAHLARAIELAPGHAAMLSEFRDRCQWRPGSPDGRLRQIEIELTQLAIEMRDTHRRAA